jgi:hypothetical protein
MSTQRCATAFDEEPPGSRRQDSMVVTSDPQSTTHTPPIVHRFDRGEVRIWLAAPRIMVIKYMGYADAGCVDFVESVFAQFFGEHSGVQLFVDCEEQTGYDMAFRERLAEWGGCVQPQVRSVCVFVRSRIVAFGVAVVSVLIGRTSTTVTTREAFCDSLNAAIGESVGRPNPGAA